MMTSDFHKNQLLLMLLKILYINVW